MSVEPQEPPSKGAARSSVNGDYLVLDWKAAQAAFLRQDYADAIRRYRVLGESGDALALVHVGWMTKQGLGTAADPASAEELYREAISRGEPEGAMALAQMFAGKRDWQSAKAHYSFAADHGILAAAFRIGVHELSDGNEREALDWLKRAHKAGHVWSAVAIANFMWRSHGIAGKVRAICMACLASLRTTVFLTRYRRDDWRDSPRLRK